MLLNSVVPMPFKIYKGTFFFACYVGYFYRNSKWLFTVEIRNNKAKNIKGVFNIAIQKKRTVASESVKKNFVLHHTV